MNNMIGVINLLMYYYIIGLQDDYIIKIFIFIVSRIICHIRNFSKKLKMDHYVIRKVLQYSYILYFDLLHVTSLWTE